MSQHYFTEEITEYFSPKEITTLPFPTDFKYERKTFLFHITTDHNP